jgi:hypothetical protein
MVRSTLEIFKALDAPSGRSDPYPLYAELHELGEAVPIGPGQVALVGYDVMPILGAWNRDPRRFSSPGTFDPRRDEGRPLSFGGGALARRGAGSCGGPCGNVVSRSVAKPLQEVRGRCSIKSSSGT